MCEVEAVPSLVLTKFASSEGTFKVFAPLSGYLLAGKKKKKHILSVSHPNIPVFFYSLFFRSRNWGEARKQGKKKIATKEKKMILGINNSL